MAEIMIEAFNLGQPSTGFTGRINMTKGTFKGKKSAVFQVEKYVDQV